MSPRTAALAARVSGRLGRALLELPEGLQARLGGPAPAAAPDLAPEARLLARAASRFDPPPPADPRALGSPAARAAFTAQAMAVGGRPAFDGRIEDRPLGGRPARWYEPARWDGGTLLFLHGGGWVRGDLDSHDAPCRVLAREAGVRVVAVDYRLAPEHPWPAAADDALAAWQALAAQVDPVRCAVGGDSAGGNLAAVACLDARERGLPLPAFQLLVYPGVDFSRKHPSIKTFSEGFLLGEADTDRYKRLYAPAEADWTDPRASPLLAASHAGLPPALVVTAAADPLRDEGEAYAAALREAGVAVQLHRHPHVHGFLNFTTARSARAGIAIMAEALRTALA